MPEIVEVVRLRANTAQGEQLVAQRPQVDAEVGKLAGFAGSELVHLGGEEWMLLVYWETRADVEAAQKVTEGLTIITDWINVAEAFVSFHTSVIHHDSRTEFVTKGKSS